MGLLTLHHYQWSLTMLTSSRVFRREFSTTRSNSLNNLLCVPSAPIPSIYCISGHTKAACPLCQSQSFPIVLKYYIIASIVVLFLTNLPPTIIRTIWSIIVLASKRVFNRWSWPHAGKKVFKRFPLFTIGNAPSTIKSVVFDIRIVTTVFHISPCTIFWCLCFIFSVSMMGNCFNLTCLTFWCSLSLPKMCAKILIHDSLLISGLCRGRALTTLGPNIIPRKGGKYPSQ